MNIQFLESSKAGMQWMRRYYREQPQLNKRKAYASFFTAQKNLTEGLVRAHQYEDLDGVFEYSIIGTPFSIIYTQRHSSIYIIDIRDPRGQRSAKAIQQFEIELKKKLSL